MVGSVSWTSAKPNFTNCPPFPPSNALDDLLFDEVSVKVILLGLQLKPYKASAMSIFWYEQLNNVKWIYPVASIYRFPGYIQDTGSEGCLGEQEIPWCHVAPV